MCPVAEARRGAPSTRVRPRLLFASYHGYVDPSSGAAIATRDLLELLARRGWDCRVFCGPALDFQHPESLPQLLSDQHLPFEESRFASGPCPFSLYHFRQNAVGGTLYAPWQRRGRVPQREEGAAFLALFERLLDRFRPDVLLTYGGHWLAHQTIVRARRRGIAVVFWLRNCAYQDARLFNSVQGVVVPSEYAATHYRDRLGLECTVIPTPMDPVRVRCERTEGRHYVTFVNPQPSKGVFVFARIAQQLAQRRPDIPLLVVEGRATVEWLSGAGVDLSGAENLHMMANTPDPRDFYRVSRIVLVPSLWADTFPRVAVESLINGIPVLGSRRGGIPEVLQEAGFLFDVPERYTPQTRIAPSPEEVRPWVETVIRLWYDAPFYRHESERCLRAAKAWRPELLAETYDAFFRRQLKRKQPSTTR